MSNPCQPFEVYQDGSGLWRFVLKATGTAIRYAKAGNPVHLPGYQTEGLAIRGAWDYIHEARRMKTLRRSPQEVLAEKRETEALQPTLI